MKVFNKKFKINEFKLKQIGNWNISLRPTQVTLGTLVLSLNRKCNNFSELTEEEGKQLVVAFKEIDNILKLTFKPQKINYLALMMIDEQVHYHVIPRYETSVVFNNCIYTDVDWPMPINIGNHLDNINLEELLSYIKACI